MLHSIPQDRAELVKRLESDPQLRKLLAEARQHDDGDSAHDLGHLLRVTLWALRLAGPTLPFGEVVAAALLHDLVNVPKNHPDRARASELSAEAAAPLLVEAGFAPEALARVQAAIREHSFSRGSRPSGPLGAVLQDADRLEALGAIGLMRVFSTGARLGSRYFHPEDPWAARRELDDRAYSVDHFFTKLLALPGTMNTAAGREEAGRRVRPLMAFLESLGRELGDPWPDSPQETEGEA